MSWQILTNEAILSHVEEVIHQHLRNICIPRNSYINRVFECESVTGQRYIIKFYRFNRWSESMILGEHQFLKDCFQRELPVIPPLSFNDKTLFYLDKIPFAIFPKKGGRVIDELNEDLWKETGRLLGRLHNVGSGINGTDRIVWTPDQATKNHLKTLENAKIIPHEYHDACSRAVTQFIQKSTSLFDSKNLFLIHGDCHFGNIIYRPDEHLYIVDFDDIVCGPAVQDLWMLLPDDYEKCSKELQWFFEGYSIFRDFSQTELSLIPALKIMRQIHFAAWCSLQIHESHFKHHFPDWGSVRYWNEWIKSIYEFVNC